MVNRDQPSPQGSRLFVPGPEARDREALSALQYFVSGALRVYKVAISPLLPSSCRFHPTCSEYMRDAVHKYGAARGVWLGVRRLMKCHPFHPGGVDLVP